MRSKTLAGIAAGLVAGLVGGIAAVVFGYVGVFIGLLQQLPPPMIDVVITRLVLDTSWGLIFGALYATVHDVIPGKGISKGLCYGLLLYLISSVRPATFLAAYTFVPLATNWVFVGFFNFASYGIILGALYKK